MSRMFVDVGMSLDGYIAGPGNPLGDRGLFDPPIPKLDLEPTGAAVSAKVTHLFYKVRAR